MSRVARERLGRLEALACSRVLLALVAVTLPELGSDPWRFRPGAVDPPGPLAPLVRAAGEEWDVGIARAAAFLAALLCGAAALTLLRERAPGRAGPAIALVLAVGVLLAAPSTLLQLGLRDSTAPWFFTNDSTYQIEQGGDLVLDGENPYGHDYRESGLERFYTRDGSVSERVREREVALRHFAYFPGAPLSAAAWRVLPEPFDDYRLLVLLATLATLGRRARVPRAARVAAGDRRAAGVQPDRGALGLVRAERRAQPPAAGARLRAGHALALRLGGGQPGRGGAAQAVRARGAAVPGADGGARRRRPRRARRAALAFGGVALAGVLPFLIADPVAFYDDTVSYGAGTYRIVGYGLSAILVRARRARRPRRQLPVRADRPAHVGAADRVAAARSAPLEGAVDRGGRASRSRSCG